MGRSPTQLSLDFLNKSGWTCQIVEKWNAHAKIRQDCFGFGDILAYRYGIVLVQTTSWSNFSTRRQKIIASTHCRGWLAAGGRIWRHGWGPKGLREEEILGAAQQE